MPLFRGMLKHFSDIYICHPEPRKIGVEGFIPSKITLMKPVIFIFSLLTVVMVSCKKEEPSAVISYKVSETSSAVPAYTVTYSAEGITKTEGPITTPSWTSSGHTMNNGDQASITLDGGTGTGSFSFSIYKNGILQVNATFDSPFGPKTITFDVIL